MKTNSEQLYTQLIGQLMDGKLIGELREQIRVPLNDQLYWQFIDKLDEQLLEYLNE